jgi:hypothetical protein
MPSAKTELSPPNDEHTYVTRRTRLLLLFGASLGVSYWLVLVLITISSLNSTGFGLSASILALEISSLPLTALLFRVMNHRVAADAAALAYRDALSL